FRDPASFGLSTLSLHDALPISCTRALKVSGALASIAPCRTTQRNVAWIWPPGHPNRSYKSRWRNAVSRSSRHRRLTTRRPSHTRSEEHTSELQSRSDLVCRLLL